MSIERAFGDYDGDITITCDECGNEYETGHSNFYDAIDEWKSRGGKASRVAGEWLHTCSDCARFESEDDFEDLS